MAMKGNLPNESFNTVMERLTWEQDAFYSGAFELSAKYPLVGIDSLIASQVVYGLIILWGFMRKGSGSGGGEGKALIQDGRWALRFYNLVQVVLSGYMAYLATITFGHKVFTQGCFCQPMLVAVESDVEYYELETFTSWLFYISKWVDYVDTLFIIARAKWRQFSFLHLFHHSSMIALTWTATRYHPCGYFLIAVQLNAPVHFIMYFYYLLSSFPALTPFLWWKNYITSIQLLQFFTGILITIYCVAKQIWGPTELRICLGFLFVFTLYGFVLIHLFSAFYRKTYSKKPAATSSDKKSVSSGKSKKDM